MKSFAKFLFLVAISIGLNAKTAQAVDACGGCADVKVVREKFRAIPAKSEQAPQTLIDAASKAVKNLTRSQEGLWTPAQAHEVVELLRVADPYDPSNIILDDISLLIAANLKQVMAEVHRLPAKEAKEVDAAIKVAVASDENSDYAPKKK